MNRSDGGPFRIVCPDYAAIVQGDLASAWRRVDVIESAGRCPHEHQVLDRNGNRLERA